MRILTSLIGKVTRILLLWNLGADCLMETLRPLGVSKIKPVLWTMTSTADERVKSYYGRFQGPRDLKLNYANNLRGTFIQVSDSQENSEFEANYTGSFSKYSYPVLSLRSASASEILMLRLETPYSGNMTQTEFIPTSCKFGIKRSKKRKFTKYKGFVRNCGPNEGSEIQSFFNFAFNKFGASKYVQETTSYDNWPENSASVIVNNAKVAKDGVVMTFLDFTSSKVGTREYPRIADVYWTFSII